MSASIKVTQKQSRSKLKRLFGTGLLFFGPLVGLVMILFGFMIILLIVFGVKEDEGSGIDENEIPSEYIPIYQAAEEEYGVPWNLLAAHHRIETRFSTMETMVSPAGAIGHMQFMPLTWVGWEYPGGDRLGNADIPDHILTDPAVIERYGGMGVDGNGDGKADPWDIEDAIFSAANYLAENGAAEGNIREAVYLYNRSEEYVADVLHYAEVYSEVYSEEPKNQIRQ